MLFIYVQHSTKTLIGTIDSMLSIDEVRSSSYINSLIFASKSILESIPISFFITNRYGFRVYEYDIDGWHSVVSDNFVDNLIRVSLCVYNTKVYKSAFLAQKANQLWNLGCFEAVNNIDLMRDCSEMKLALSIARNAIKLLQLDYMLEFALLDDLSGEILISEISI